MHSTLTRAQAVFGLFTTIAFFLAVSTAVSVLFYPQTPTAELSMRSNQVVNGRPSPRSPKKLEYAHIRFDLDADLTTLYNYNTKQVFVYVLATWPSSSQTPHSAVIWDAILPSPPTLFSPAYAKLQKLKNKKSKSNKSARTVAPPTTNQPGLLKLKNQRPKYPIADISGLLSGQGNATLELGYNVQPWVGALTWNREGKLGRWQGLDAQSQPWAFAQRKLNAREGAEGEKRKAAGGKVEEGRATPVVAAD